MEYWLPGDDFTIAGSGLYQVNTIRVWSTDSTGLSLWFGPQGGTILNIGTYTHTPVAYMNGEGYQGSSGAFYQIYQIDFTLNQVMTAGTTYQFFLDGPWKLYDSSRYINAFLHGSNAGLSGSMQDGADDTFLWLHWNNGLNEGVETWYSGDGGGSSGWGAGWDKNSDANVQVYGAPVPIPPTVFLLGGGLLGLVGIRRRFWK